MRRSIRLSTIRAGAFAATVFAALTLAFVPACGTDPPDEETACTSDTDCPSGEYCSTAEVCTSDCDPETPGGCDGDELCTPRGRCERTSCNEDSACPSSYHCSEGFCARECDPEDGSSCSDGETCTSRGRCEMVGECADDSDCESPPPDRCDASTLRTFAAPGSCEGEGTNRSCNYPMREKMCEYGCSEGACEPNPCKGKTCDSPPAATCASNGSELVTYASPGTCQPDQGGECTYEDSRTGCPHGCMNGTCNAGPCSSVTCDDPPKDECDGNVALTYQQMGTCKQTQNGTKCSYSPKFDHCSYTGANCQSAQCVNPINQKGGVVITEYMADPEGRVDRAGEWFEIENTGSSSVNLRSWTIASKDNSDHAIGAGLNLAPGNRAVLAISGDPAGDGSVAVDYEYDGIHLANGSDWIRLKNPAGDIVDHVFYETGSILDGRSRKLDPSATVSASANDDYQNWCPSLSSGEKLSNGDDWGSPGATNPPCSSNPCSSYTCQRPDGFCKMGDAVRPTKQMASCTKSRFNNPNCDFGVRTFNCTSSELCAEGRCRSIPSNVPAKGDVVITEIMGDPDAVSDSDGEWLELYNTTGSKVSLFSLILEDTESGASHDEYTILDTSAEIPAGSHAVLAVETDPSKNGGIQNAYEYDGSHLKNSPGGLKIRLVRQDGTLVDASYYGAPTTGESQQLSRTKYKQGASNPEAANDSGSNWCAPTSTYGSGDKGTPGSDNRTCP